MAKRLTRADGLSLLKPDRPTVPIISPQARTLGPGLAALLTCFATNVQATTEAEQGFELARALCSRCHVIGDYNRMGGIGNSPSFPWMVKSLDWEERFRTFYTRRPHPVFVRVPGYPRWSDVDPYYPPFEIKPHEIELITEYAGTLR